MINIRDYRKIIIIGSGGSGKSTFARRLGEVTGLPVTHLDVEYWQPEWTGTPREEWIRKQESIVAGEKWIVDGNYGSTLELRYAAADLVVFLDISRITCVISAAKRTGRKRPDLPEFLTEPKMFSRDFLEFAGWIWKYPSSGRKKVLELHEKYPDTPFLQVKHRRELEKYLK